jgi:hypothetical protein
MVESSACMKKAADTSHSNMRKFGATAGAAGSGGIAWAGAFASSAILNSIAGKLGRLACFPAPVDAQLMLIWNDLRWTKTLVRRVFA